jgi:hypothetical protein
MAHVVSLAPLRSERFFFLFLVIGIRPFRMIPHADLSSAFLLHLLTPIDFRSFPIQSSHFILVFLLSAMFLTFAVFYFAKLSFFQFLLPRMLPADSAKLGPSTERDATFCLTKSPFFTTWNWLIANCPNLFPITRRLFKNGAADHCQL